MCVDVLTLVEIILLLQSCGWSRTRCLPGESLSRVHDVSLAFVLALESHLCHRTGIPFEALVSMLRVCIVLRYVHGGDRALGQRLRTT